MLTEEGDCTRADAVLEVAGRRFHSFGRAKRASQDPSVPVVGQDLAAARTLSELSRQLLDAAAGQIEACAGHPVGVHG
jgi:uncharacterized protein DUF1876